MIVVFSKELDKVLFCIRAKEPYKGMYNFVGGKVEEGETNDFAASFTNNNHTIQTSSNISKKLPIYSVQTEEKKVAFTMNCAW